MQDQIPYVISSVFLRRILQPGISLSSALSATIMDQKKYMTDYEVQSLSISGLKKELLSIIESEVSSLLALQNVSSSCYNTVLFLMFHPPKKYLTIRELLQIHCQCFNIGKGFVQTFSNIGVGAILHMVCLLIRAEVLV